MDTLDPFILAWALPAVAFVNIAVALLKIACGRRTPAYVQVVAAVISGQVAVFLLAIHGEVRQTPSAIAGLILAGIYASSLAAGIKLLIEKSSLPPGRRGAGEA